LYQWSEAKKGLALLGRPHKALEAIVDLDLTELADIEPPRGYGRD
jgi:hypothetical protein